MIPVTGLMLKEDNNPQHPITNNQLHQLPMKKRLDILISNKFGLTRNKAQALIMAGNIYIDGKPQTKSGLTVAEDVTITMIEAFPYVSRGALKLKKAIETFDIDLHGKTIADIGASTGGFTDYALQNGADKVYAIDCGYGQLDQKLRNDKRVINMERTNIKDVEALPESIDMFVIDVSFISLKKILPQVITIISNFKFLPARSLKTKEGQISNCDVIALIKPQFEVGKEVADKYRGVITDENIRQAVVADIKNFATKSGFIIEGLTESPIKGAKGNKEFLLYLTINI